MKIKTQLIVGVGLLFTLILLLSIVGIYNINWLKKYSDNTLSNNFNSLQYCKDMLTSIDSDLAAFEKPLRLQEKNITEPGEEKLTMIIQLLYSQLLKTPSDSVKRLLHARLYDVMDLNTQAILLKNEQTKKIADRAVLWVSITSTLCFMLAFILFVNLPSQISDPIKKLTGSIQQIASNNYTERVHLSASGEFSQLANSFNDMAAKLEGYNKSNLAKILSEKKRIETIVQNIQDPVIGLDENLNIIFVNDAVQHIIGIPQNLLIQHTLMEIASQNDLVKKISGEIANEGTKTNLPKTIKIISDGKEQFYEIDISSVNLNTDHLADQSVGYLILLKNVTSHKELDAAKTNFIAMVSHEFKTPISSIKMSLQLLENQQTGTLNSEQKSLIQDIHDESDRLLKFTKELLNMSQIQSGKIKLNISRVDIKEMIDYSINVLKSQAVNRNILFSTEYVDPLPFVNCDQDKTTWVLGNLISNAIQYSPDHTEIEIRAERKDSQLLVKIKDHGPGIPQEYLSRIFEPYFRVPDTHQEGTGLGLSICKEFMEAQGGSISITSSESRGTMFSLRFEIGEHL